MSPANRTDGYYDDMDDYSPVVSDIEDPNDDDMDSMAKFKRKDELDKDNNDILQKILNEQSASMCELEEDNVSDQGDHDDVDEAKESTYGTILFQFISRNRCSTVRAAVQLLNLHNFPKCKDIFGNLCFGFDFQGKKRNQINQTF